MRFVLFILLLLPAVLYAQDGKRFQRALNARSEHSLDRWVKHELHRHRTRQLISTPNGSYSSYAPTYDSLVAFLRRQPGVEDAAWDKCMNKLDIWPGHSNIGVRWHARGQVFERCWMVQEGITGAMNLFGWRPHVRKDREHLKYKRALKCPGFVEDQRRYCTERH
jgi:hypothetical protein